MAFHAREKGVCKREQKAWRADFVDKCAERLEARGATTSTRWRRTPCTTRWAGASARSTPASTSCGRSARSATRSWRWRAALRDALQAEQAAERQASRRKRSSAAREPIAEHLIPGGTVPRRGGAQAGGTSSARRSASASKESRRSTCAERAKYREGVREAQRSEKEKALERRARADEARAIALEALARTVPYFEAISNIENDVTKTTAAVEAQRADQRTAADKTGYTTGLTDERVFRDPAFKVGLAMRSLGVARTGAARDAVARLVGPRAVNPITGARC